MIQAALTRHPGVHRRTDSGIYQFGLRVPVDLRSQFPTAWAVRCSLDTADLRTANNKARALQAEWATKFEALRQGKPVPVDMTALREKLLGRVESLLAAADTRTVLMASEERRERAATIAWQLEEARYLQAEGRIPDWAEDSLRSMAYERSAVADAEALAYLVMYLELYHESLCDLSRAFPLRVNRLGERRALAAFDSPKNLDAGSDAGAKDVRYRMAHALDAWTTAKSRPAKTVEGFARHAAQFTSMMGDPALSSIDRRCAIQFRDRLQDWAVAEGKTARTADNSLVTVRALVNVARNSGWIEGNPFEGLTVEVGGRNSEGREPWTYEELKVIFSDPIWAEYKLPSAKKAGAEAAYWIPLIGCYTGARISEIAQLWTDDLSLAAGEEAIEFRANSIRNQVLKSAGSWRVVPMHSELVRLGLPDYVATLPTGPLFPKLPLNGKNGAGGQFSQWFGRFKLGKGYDSPRKSFHSFRHLVATELRLAKATDPQADAITGHLGDGLGRNVYSATIRRQAQRLRPVIELLSFPGLELRRVLP